MLHINKKLVEVTLVGKNGKVLPSYQKDGQVYFGGKKGERYEIKIRNNSNSGVEVVATVDGLSVMSGEPGDWKAERGYIIHAYDSIKIDGYRRNEDEVAAFRFTNSDDPTEDSYAGRKDMPENLGVIGIAVFKEKEQPTYSIRPWDGWYGGRQSERKYGTRGLRSTGSGSIDEGMLCSNSSFDALDTHMERTVEEPEIGTEYGEVRDSHVHEVSFTRENHNRPNEVIQLEYDTVANLQRRGVTTPVTTEKEAFPGMAGVEAGYAAPPPPKPTKGKRLPGGSQD